MIILLNNRPEVCFRCQLFEEIVPLGYTVEWNGLFPCHQIAQGSTARTRMNWICPCFCWWRRDLTDLRLVRTPPPPPPPTIQQQQIVLWPWLFVAHAETGFVSSVVGLRRKVLPLSGPGIKYHQACQANWVPATFHRPWFLLPKSNCQTYFRHRALEKCMEDRLRNERLKKFYLTFQIPIDLRMFHQHLKPRKAGK